MSCKSQRARHTPAPGNLCTWRWHSSHEPYTPGSRPTRTAYLHVVHAPDRPGKAWCRGGTPALVRTAARAGQPLTRLEVHAVGAELPNRRMATFTHWKHLNATFISAHRVQSCIREVWAQRSACGQTGQWRTAVQSLRTECNHALDCTLLHPCPIQAHI